MVKNHVVSALELQHILYYINLIHESNDRFLCVLSFDITFWLGTMIPKLLAAKVRDKPKLKRSIPDDKLILESARNCFSHFKDAIVPLHDWDIQHSYFI